MFPRLIAIALSDEVEIEDATYQTADALKVEYEGKLSQVRMLSQKESDSIKAYESARYKIERLPANVDGYNQESAMRQIREIISELEQVQSGTTVEQDARALMTSAEKKLRQIKLNQQI